MMMNLVTTVFILGAIGSVQAGISCHLCQTVRPSLVAECMRACGELSRDTAWMLTQCVAFVNQPGSGITSITSCINEYKAIETLPVAEGVLSSFFSPVVARLQPTVEFPACDVGTARVISSPLIEGFRNVVRNAHVIICNGTLDSPRCPESSTPVCRIFYDPPAPDTLDFPCYQPTPDGMCVGYRSDCSFSGFGAVSLVGNKPYFATADSAVGEGVRFICNIGGEVHLVAMEYNWAVPFVWTQLVRTSKGYLLARPAVADASRMVTSCSLHIPDDGHVFSCLVRRSGKASNIGIFQVAGACLSDFKVRPGTPCWSGKTVVGVYHGHSYSTGHQLAVPTYVEPTNHDRHGTVTEW